MLTSKCHSSTSKMRKSTSAKKDNYSWINCSKCNRKIVKSSLKNHETDCNLEKISYIEDNKYFGQKSSFKINLPDIEKIAEISKDVLQPYLFIPDSLGQLLDLKMGCLVTLLVNDKIYVKKVWSVTDSNSDVVYSVAEGKNWFFRLPLDLIFDSWSVLVPEIIRLNANSRNT